MSCFMQVEHRGSDCFGSVSLVQDWPAVHDQQAQPRAERERRGSGGGAE